MKKAEAKSKTEESRSIHQFWSGAVIPPGVKRIVNKKHDVTVSVNQLAGLISQLTDQTQAKRAALQDQGFRPDPLHEDWFRAPIVEFVQRHSTKSASSSSRERLDAAHQTPKGNLSGTPNVTKSSVGTRNSDEADSNKHPASKKPKHTFRPKERLHSYDRSSYHRGDGGDAQRNGQFRPPPNGNAARSEDGYHHRMDESSHSQTGVTPVMRTRI